MHYLQIKILRITEEADAITVAKGVHRNVVQ